ncbi:hypothetical protein K438DRAFT_1833647 [Mycena galopus ATCC 62051]|nr:hypothetical protein K438DRAFT_1833647 [Mycena galopus ATCC 62051]
MSLEGSQSLVASVGIHLRFLLYLGLSFSLNCTFSATCRAPRPLLRVHSPRPPQKLPRAPARFPWSYTRSYAMRYACATRPQHHRAAI